MTGAPITVLDPTPSLLLANGRAPLTVADVPRRPAPAPRHRVPGLAEARRRVGEELGLRGAGHATSRFESPPPPAPDAPDAPEPKRDPDPRRRPQRSGGRTGHVIADAFARGEVEALDPTPRQRVILRRICRCRTAALGATHERCGDCNFEQVVFCSCGDRHCPLCLSLAGERWLRAELERALPCAHFHLVLTLPPALRPLARRDEGGARAVYGILFRAARSAIEQVAREELGEPGARLAITEVLHTWNRHHRYHPHVHAIVSAGALSADGERWLEARPGRCLIPRDALGDAYRDALAHEFDRALRLGRRGKPGGLFLASAEAKRIKRTFHGEYQHVYSKAIMDPEQALRYLARYTGRPGFSDARLVRYDPQGPGEVVYRTKLGEEVRCTRKEFTRRLLTHVLPRGFHRIRRYALLAPRGQTERVATARRALGAEQASDPAAGDRHAAGSFVHLFYLELGVDLTRCPNCNGLLYSSRLAPLPLDLGELYARPPPS